MDNPTIAYNNDPSKLITPEDFRILREQCDDVVQYKEAGWHCVRGYREGKRLVHAHSSSPINLNPDVEAETRRYMGYR